MILPCTCKHAFHVIKVAGGARQRIPLNGKSDAVAYQEAKYGAGNRVHNPCKNGGFCCSVCGEQKGSAKK